MTILCCFPSLAGRNKKNKEEDDNNKVMQVKLQQLGKPVDVNEFDHKSKSKSTFTVDVPFSIPKSSTCNVKVVSHESPVKAHLHEEEEEEEEAYEGEDEHEKDYNSDHHRHREVSIGKTPIQEPDEDRNTNIDDHQNDNSSDVEMNSDGHVSDPGASKTPFLGSPKLKRSCSNLETKRVLSTNRMAPCESFDDLQKLGDGFMSPVSVTSNYSADKVILRKCSSSQILPSKSRKLWWKLFLWSHRNLHEPIRGVQNKLLLTNQQGGYSSDTLESSRRLDKSKSKSKLSKLGKVNNGDLRWNSLHQGSGFWPQNQWMAFPGSPSSQSPLTRVDEWVQEIPTEPGNEEEEEEREITFPPSPENGKAPATARNFDLPEEIAYANRVIQSLNSSSTVAYISGMGLKVIPSISGFSSLRSVNLSGNSIVYITPGSLPKGLHILNISRNKIGAIEGLRELTRLRILDLSYNRISRIGQGLSNCTLIKELYLAGNKISSVEGLHRLRKLTIVDLSFNKITTSKALGQLVANYNSLQALNLLGNPIQSNISEDQMRKTLCGLLPKLAYLNKQPVNPQKAREVAREAVVKAALGSGGLSGRRRSGKRVGGVGSSSSVSRHRSGGGGGGGQKGSGRHVVKPSRAHHRSTK